MVLDYQLIVDDIFGSAYKHRTLRTIFDPNSSEWNETNMLEKLEIVRVILESNKIDFKLLVTLYKNYYNVEMANKGHVAKRLEDGLISLLLNSIQVSTK
jgi:hypothetical protein